MSDSQRRYSAPLNNLTRFSSAVNDSLTITPFVLTDEIVVLFVANKGLFEVVRANAQHLEVVFEVVDAAELEEALEGIQSNRQLDLG